jgi:tRNA synthetases class I (E and Q), catalytic domain
MRRVRFPPSPTGSLHVGNALTAAANRSFGDWLLLRIDDTDPSRTVEHGEREIVRDLEWLGIAWDDGPVRQSDRQDRYRAAAERLGGDRFGRITLLRPDGTATYHLASVVDDIEFEITHVISSIADLRDAGIPAEAVRAYLDELGMPKHDVQLDLPRIRRLAMEAIGAMPDEELAAHAVVSLDLVPALRGARDLNEAREYASQILEPEPVRLPEEAKPTLERFKELADGDARETVRELKGAGGDLHALRLALTGRDRGSELWTVIHALSREEALRRVDAAL